MKVGIIGLPLSGKSTVFNSLTGGNAAVRSWQSKSEEANIGTIKVPDERLQRLSEIYTPRKTTPAEVVFVDMPGLESDPTSARGLDSLFVQQVQDVNAFALILRAFADANVPHPFGRIDPLEDFKSAIMDLILSDMSVIERRRERLARDIQRGKEEARREMSVIERCASLLEDEQLLYQQEFSNEERRWLRGYQFMTMKPLLAVINVDENPDDTSLASLKDYLIGRKLQFIQLSASIEMEIAQLPPEEQAEFLEELGITLSARDRFIRAAYDLLNLSSFFTVGPDEVRAWTIEKNEPAVEAAGAIHSDISRGFIRAEVISYDDFIRVDGDMNLAKAQGLLRLEGKTYPVQDGDIINFRFNV
ncbi:MAG: redox-regulated ATPase YchF [bacterium]|jgi:GTP-binding protein YchF|nr:redox-regulated ATPase YchF [bacterium]MDD4152569.1 redox-regulated ATPase YchF [bacterium]MDD4558478.1 redox-regulated ATPase YchF [bacterium]